MALSKLVAGSDSVACPQEPYLLLCLQNLWKTPAARRDESIRCLFWYALVYLVPTGIFTAALNSISYSICNSQTVGPRMDWFCHSHFLQFLFTIILPMVLLMLWQNAVIPAYFYK